MLNVNLVDLFCLQKFGVETSDVRLALASDDSKDQLLIAYYLILDNRRINAEGRSSLFVIQHQK